MPTKRWPVGKRTGPGRNGACRPASAEVNQAVFVPAASASDSLQTTRSVAETATGVIRLTADEKGIRPPGQRRTRRKNHRTRINATRRAEVESNSFVSDVISSELNPDPMEFVPRSDAAATNAIRRGPIMLKGKLSGVPVQFLSDTGAESTVISLRCLDSLPKEIRQFFQTAMAVWSCQMVVRLYRKDQFCVESKLDTER
jgi:hypothetical protein